MADNNIDLDLTKVKSSDHTTLASKIDTYYNTDSRIKQDLAYHWERNHLMLDGKQWLVYQGEQTTTGRQWSELRVNSANDYIPRPVTNYMFDAYQTLKSYLLQHRPRSTVRANTQTYKDKTGAKLAELVLDCNWERLGEETNYEHAAGVAIAYGTVFKKDFWDTSSLMTVKLPVLAPQPKIDMATGQPTGEVELVEQRDEQGQVVTEDVQLGDVNTAVVEPFRMAVDPLCVSLHEARWLMEYEITPLDVLRQRYDRKEEGYTGKAKKVKADTNLNEIMRRFYELRTSSGVHISAAGTPGTGTGGSNAMVDNAAVVKHYYERPSEKHQNGRYIVCAGKDVLYVGEPDEYGTEQDNWHPYSEMRWEVLPGRFWGRSPFDDANELQKRINSIDACIILTRKTMALPQRLIPKGAGIKKGEWTGRPGQNIDYRPVDGRGPETVSGAGVDSQVLQERAEALQSFKDITGAVDVLKGDRPPGVTAASAIELLYETSTGKLRPVLDRWKHFIESSQKKQLSLISKKYQEPREDFIRLMKRKNKDFTAEALSGFIGSDMYDNGNVVIEAGSNLPKLESVRKAELMQAAQMGVLGLESPENRIKFLEELGLANYGVEVGPDVKRAEWENSIIDEVTANAPNKAQVLPIDKHEVHVMVHENRMKEPSFMDLPIEAQQAYFQHLQEHNEGIAQAKAQMQMEMAMGAAPPPEESMGGQQGGESNKSFGKGPPNKTMEAITQRDMPPDAKIGN